MCPSFVAPLALGTRLNHCAPPLVHLLGELELLVEPAAVLAERNSVDGSKTGFGGLDSVERSSQL